MPRAGFAFAFHRPERPRHNRESRGSSKSHPVKPTGTTACLSAGGPAAPYPSGAVPVELGTQGRFRNITHCEGASEDRSHDGPRQRVTASSADSAAAVGFGTRFFGSFGPAAARHCRTCSCRGHQLDSRGPDQLVPHFVYAQICWSTAVGCYRLCIFHCDHGIP